MRHVPGETLARKIHRARSELAHGEATGAALSVAPQLRLPGRLRTIGPAGRSVTKLV